MRLGRWGIVAVWLLSASCGGTPRAVVQPSGDHSGPLRYALTSFPGVVFVDQARRVDVVAAVEPDAKIGFKVQVVRPATVSGMIVTPDGKQLTSGTIVMTPVDGDAAAPIPSDNVRILPDGSFTFRSVAPGLYLIRARAETASHDVPLFATYRLHVQEEDISGIRMPLLPGAILSGTVEYEAVASPKPLTFAGLRVRVSLSDGGSFGDAVTGEVAPDGRFTIRGLMTGTHYVSIDGLEDPWVMKHVLWRGQDVSDIALDVQSRQELDGVLITLTDVTTDVSGLVRDDGGQPVADALVVIVPRAEQFWTRISRRLAVLNTDARGHYRIRGLPPGEYRAVATLDVAGSDVHRRELLARFASEGTPLLLAERGARVVDLPLTSLSPLRRTSTR